MRYTELLYGTEKIGIYDSAERVCRYFPGVAKKKREAARSLMPYIAALLDCETLTQPSFQILCNDHLEKLPARDAAWLLHPETAGRRPIYRPLPADLKSGDKISCLIPDNYFDRHKSGRKQPALPGRHDKFMADVIETDGGRFILAPEGADKGWQGNVIVKTNGDPGFPYICENEYIFMNIAGEIGLNVPRTWLISDRKGTRHYCVERFGILLNGKTGTVYKENMSDFLGIMGIRYKDKYKIYLEDMFEIARRVLPQSDFRLFCRSWYYRYFIGDGDAHPNNFSVFIRDGKYSLAPLYDIVHLPVYGYTKRVCLPRRRGDDAEEFISEYLSSNEVQDIKTETVSKLPYYVDKVFENAEGAGAYSFRRKILSFFGLRCGECR